MQLVALRPSLETPEPAQIGPKIMATRRGNQPILQRGIEENPDWAISREDTLEKLLGPTICVPDSHLANREFYIPKTLGDGGPLPLFETRHSSR
jgi:hypothetical protein